MNEVNTEQDRPFRPAHGPYQGPEPDEDEKLSGEAESLAKALKNDKKTSGQLGGRFKWRCSWRKLGLTRDREYLAGRRTSRTARGENRRPDFDDFTCPKKKHIIIDSKVSLNAYVNGVNAPTGEEQQAFMDEHADNVRRHIETLSGKDYTSLTGMNSPDFVFMFIAHRNGLSGGLRARSHFVRLRLQEKDRRGDPQYAAAHFADRFQPVEYREAEPEHPADRRIGR